MHSWTTGEIARRLGVPEYALQNLIRHRVIEAPELVLGRRRWTEDDVARARSALVERGTVPGFDTPSTASMPGGEGGSSPTVPA